MYVTRKQCSLCLKDSYDIQEFPEADISDILKNLQKVIPQTKLQTEDSQFVCEICLQIAKQLYTFLSQFFEANFRVCHQLQVCQSSKLDIRTLYPRSSCEDGVNFSICRICLSSVEIPKVFLYASPENVLHYKWYFEMLLYCDISPKLFNMTTDPIMCDSCWQHLQTFFSFKKQYFKLHGEMLHFNEELKKRNIHASDKKIFLQKFRQLSNDYHTENVADRVDVSNFSKNKLLELLLIYLLNSENETVFSPEFWRKTTNLWNDLNKEDLITEEDMITFITLFLKGTLLSKEECNQIKDQIIQIGNVFNRGRRLPTAISQYDLKPTPSHQENNTQLTPCLSASNVPANDDYDDTCPDITSDMNQSFDFKSESLDEITIDCCPVLEDQTIVSDTDKSFMEVKLFEEQTVRTNYHFKCQKCSYKTKFQLAAIKHAMLHNKSSTRRSLRLKHQRDSISEPLSTVDNESVHAEKDAMKSTRLREAEKVSTERKRGDLTSYHMNAAETSRRKWPVGNRKGLFTKLKGVRYLNRIHK